MSDGELLLVFGPPAVGKMTVGRALADRSRFRLFHNHHTIEPLLEVFGYGTAGFDELNDEFRRRVVEVAAEQGLSIVFTYVWALDLVEDERAVRTLVAPYAQRGRPVSFLELYADLPTRLERNTGPDRVRAKPSKRDLAWSDANLREMERDHRMATDPGESGLAARLIADHRHLRIDNTHVSPGEVADRVLGWLDGRS